MRIYVTVWLAVIVCTLGSIWTKPGVETATRWGKSAWAVFLLAAAAAWLAPSGARDEWEDEE